MDESFDVSIETRNGMDTSSNMDSSVDFDLPSVEDSEPTNDSTDYMSNYEVVLSEFNCTPLNDMPMDVIADVKSPMSEQELAALQYEAGTMELPPLDDGLDLGYNYSEAIQEANAQWETESPKDFHYQAGFDNYIRPGDDFDG
jgi:hypothetical protein